MLKNNSIGKLGKELKRRLNSMFRRNSDRFLKKVSGIIHVGANTGQEINLYAQYGLSVVWIEPIPDIFEKLQANLAGFPKQKAIKGLVTDREDTEYHFHLANNNGASSSILEFNLHKDIWPDVSFERSIDLFSKTLPTLLKDHNVAPEDYDMLAIDTQGSELLVLKGAIPILQNFIYIKTEVPDFEAYKGCCQLKDLEMFLGSRGYKEISRHQFASHPGGGNYYDIVYKNYSGKTSRL
jgi:FkbM family methyltransferase